MEPKSTDKCGSGWVSVRAYRCWLGDLDGGIVFQTSAGKARYVSFKSAEEIGFATSITKIRVRRAPEYDRVWPLLQSEYAHSSARKFLDRRGWTTEYLDTLAARPGREE